MSYASDIYDAAKVAGWTAAQAAGASRTQVLAAAGYTYETVPSGTFAWKGLRGIVAARLAIEEADAADAAERAVVRTKVREIAALSGAEVSIVRAGETATGPCIVIRRAD